MKLNSLLTFAVAGSMVLLSACSGSDKQSTDEPVVAEVSEVKINGDVDIASSMVAWKGIMMGMYEHTGSVGIKEASLKMEGETVIGGKFVLDLTQLATTDENYDAEKGSTPEKLIGHLSSPDFFDVENNPTATFEITGEVDGALTGNLTLRGKTNAETIEGVSINKDGDKYKVSGTVKFDRKKYDVAFDHPMQEMVISDEVEITVNLVVS